MSWMTFWERYEVGENEMNRKKLGELNKRKKFWEISKEKYLL